MQSFQINGAEKWVPGELCVKGVNIKSTDEILFQLVKLCWSSVAVELTVKVLNIIEDLEGVDV